VGCLSKVSPGLDLEFPLSRESLYNWTVAVAIHLVLSPQQLILLGSFPTKFLDTHNLPNCWLSCIMCHPPRVFSNSDPFVDVSTRIMCVTYRLVCSWDATWRSMYGEFKARDGDGDFALSGMFPYSPHCSRFVSAQHCAPKLPLLSISAFGYLLRQDPPAKDRSWGAHDVHSSPTLTTFLFSRFVAVTTSYI
jgi:hypothetical protein